MVFCSQYRSCSKVGLHTCGSLHIKARIGIVELKQAGYMPGRESVAAGDDPAEASMVVLALAITQDVKVRNIYYQVDRESKILQCRLYNVCLL